MKNKQEALRRLREWPENMRGTKTVRDFEGKRCALGIIAGDEVDDLLQCVAYEDYIGPKFSLRASEIIHIIALNDSGNFQYVIDYIETLTDEDNETEKAHVQDEAGN